MIYVEAEHYYTQMGFSCHKTDCTNTIKVAIHTLSDGEYPCPNCGFIVLKGGRKVVKMEE